MLMNANDADSRRDPDLERDKICTMKAGDCAICACDALVAVTVGKGCVWVGICECKSGRSV